MSLEQHTAFFKAADADGKGTLSLDELVACLRNRGYSGSDYQIKKMFRSIDNNMDNEVSLDEYLEAMGAIPPVQHKKALFLKVAREFDGDDNGTLDRTEIKNALSGCGYEHSEEDMRPLMDKLDKNRDGKVSYEEFAEEVFGKS